MEAEIAPVDLEHRRAADMGRDAPRGFANGGFFQGGDHGIDDATGACAGGAMERNSSSVSESVT